jgi:hypothetical protein
MMRRRDVISLLGGAAVAWPMVARAQQQPNRVRNVAWLGVGQAGQPSPYLESLRAGLRELGWVEGRDLKLSTFWAAGLDDMVAAVRAALASDPDVIVTQEFMAIGMLQAKAAKPVVFGFSGDPVDAKLAESWARPGGNFTGMSYLAIELVGKRVELLKEWLPDTKRIAVLARPQHPGVDLERRATEEVVKKLGMELSYFPYVTKTVMPQAQAAAPPPPAQTDLETIFRAIAADRCDAVVVFPGFRDVRSQRARGRLRARCKTAVGLRLVSLRAEGIADDLRAERARALPFARTLYRPDFERRQARRPAGRGAGQVLSRDQPEDGESARHRTAGAAAHARR